MNTERPRNILIVDGNVFPARRLARLLQRSIDVLPTNVYCANEARTTLRDVPFRLVIMDNDLPQIREELEANRETGIALAREIWSTDGPNNETPILFLMSPSSGELPELVLRTEGKNFDRILKPTTNAEIATRSLKLLGKE